ncbi:MAG: alpha/beta fold hydrolase [Planctomycetes bacterium]|nr:alpha/beta fold hydrolase [Planctomycetota bacterium]
MVTPSEASSPPGTRWPTTGRWLGALLVVRLALAAACASAAAAAGDGWFVWLLLAAVVGIDPALRWIAPQRRGRELLLELPVQAAGLLALGWLTVEVLLRQKGTEIAPAALVRFAGYVLLWLLALRQVHRLLLRVAGLAPWLRRHRDARTVLCAAVLVVGGMPQLFVALQTHRIAVGQTPDARFAGAAAREVGFANPEGLMLRGTLLRRPDAAPDTPVVIVCHGLGANRAMFFGYAQLAFELGCHVLAFDFRAHGHSAGMVTTIGAGEAEDVVAAAEFVRSEGGMRGPLVLVGVSMGAATALRAAGTVADAVFAESSYADLTTMLEARMGMLGPAAPLASTLAQFAALCQLGVDLTGVSPRRALAALPAEIPVVLVHAGADGVIPIDEGRRLAAARPGLELHVIPGAGHGYCLFTARRRIEGLLRELLASIPPPDRRRAR